MKIHPGLLLWFAVAILFGWFVYEQSPSVREARDETDQEKVFQKARSQYSELEKLANNKTDLQQKATQFIKLSNENRVFLSSKERRVQVPIESKAKIVLALFSAEAAYWTNQLHKTGGSEIKIFLIQQAYQYIILSGQSFDKFGLSEDVLNNQYRVAISAWNEKHKHNGPGNIALPPTILICPIYTITLDNQPLDNTGRDQVVQAVLEIAKTIKN